MVEFVAIAGMSVAAALIVYIFRRQLLHQRALELLGAGSRGDADEGERLEPDLRPFARRHYVLPWGFAAFVAAGAYLALDVFPPFALAFGFLTGLLAGQCDAMLLARKHAKIEEQLADAIALMVGAVNAGAGLQRALETAAAQSQTPLKPVLDEALARVRYGDVPLDVMAQVRARVPLETFRLFTTALAVNWQVGGSLSQTLANVERVIRDRIEINRRVDAMSMQVRVSVAGVLAVTYLLAALVWRNDPPRMVMFLSSTVGQLSVALAMTLQGVGIVWLTRMTKLKF